MIKQLLDGNLDSNQYEDMLRDMFGIYAYVAFTMDKVVQNIVRQLQHMVSDESSQQCTELFVEESKNDGTGGPCATSQLRSLNEANYLKKAEQVLEDENCYKATIYKNESKLTIEYLETESPDGSDEEDSEEKWSNFLQKEYCKDSNKSRAVKRLFLSRNVRCYMAREEKLGKSDKSIDAKENSNGKGESNKESEFQPENCKRMLVFDSGVHVSFYRRNRSTSSKPKSKEIKKVKFASWNIKWIDKNVSSGQLTQYNEWLKGSAPIDASSKK